VPNNSGLVDIRTIKALVQLMARHDMNEIDLRDGEVRVRLLRGVMATMPAASSTASALPVAASREAETTVSDEAIRPATPTRKLLEIKSPAVGTFFASANPDAPPFVRAGDRVTPTTVVGLLEAMKTYTEIPADCSGVIVEVLVRNQQPIEFDTILFRVDPGA
jgi:acetyl-CoA carboxylase biotin carboxyl carrier protein